MWFSMNTQVKYSYGKQTILNTHQIIIELNVNNWAAFIIILLDTLCRGRGKCIWEYIYKCFFNLIWIAVTKTSNLYVEILFLVWDYSLKTLTINSKLPLILNLTSMIWTSGLIVQVFNLSYTDKVEAILIIYFYSYSRSLGRIGTS